MARSELARVAERAWQEGMDKGRDFKDIMQDVAEAVANAIDDSLERVGGYYAHGKAQDKATPVTVYVVKITTKTLHPTFTIGAVYLVEEEAKAEVHTLNEKNSYTRASYVARQLG